jgi:predicted esterase
LGVPKKCIALTRAVTKTCPGQSYALFGYSQGATLILNALDQLDAAALSLVKSVYCCFEWRTSQTFQPIVRGLSERYRSRSIAYWECVINQGLRDCPGQSYALFGYSQGATLILNALDQLDAQDVLDIRQAG